MIAALVSVILFIAVIIPAAGNGEWGTVGVTVVIMLVMLGIGSAARWERKAYYNAIDYWARGGPEQRR